MKRDQSTLKKIIIHINIGNYIITDSWGGYNFLDYPRFGYIYHIFNISIVSFGTCLDSTRRIESIWNELKE